MTEHREQTSLETVTPVVNPTAATEPAAPEVLSSNGGSETTLPPNRHAEAGRKGAHRRQELIERGRLYEQEHGLKRGRQRLRQLIEEGRVYEQEHGLSPRKRTGRSRLSRDQVLRRLLELLTRIAKPSYRQGLVEVLEALEGEVKQETESRQDGPASALPE